MPKTYNLKVMRQIGVLCATLERDTNAYYVEHLSNLTPPVFYPELGNKYTRIVKRDSLGSHDSLGSQRSVICFVRNEDGAILKAASWKAPAKHVRGSIFAPNCDVGVNVDHYGARYLK